MFNLTKLIFMRVCRTRSSFNCLNSQFWNEFSTRLDSAATVPVIKYPQAFKQRMIKKNKSKTNRKKSAFDLAKPGKLLISCDNKRDRMFTSDITSKFKPPTITSATWTSFRSPGRHFTIHPIRENPSFKIETQLSFEKLLLSEEILNALRIAEITDPTVIQFKAIPEIMSGKNVMLAAETGSGKTLAYLLPIVSRLLRTQQDNDVAALESASPRALILVPTRELCNQVQRMGSSLNLPLKFQSVYSSSQVKNLESGATTNTDILVATPATLIKALKQRRFDLNDLEFAVLDECDTLLDDSFSKDVIHIMSRFNIFSGKRKPISEGRSVQLILSSATYPEYAQDCLSDIISFDEIVSVKTGFLHRVSPHVTHKFLRMKPSEKLNQLMKLIETSGGGQTIVFCNYKKTALFLHQQCLLNGIPVAMVGASSTTKDRMRSMRDFEEGKQDILIATDLISRGLDTKLVKHVINYELSNDVSDYIHRAGRVGRVGQDHEGLVTTLITRKWEIPVVMEIEEAARRRQQINDVSANIKNRHQLRWDEKRGDEEEELLGSNQSGPVM